MTLHIELPDNLDAVLKARSRASVVSEAGFARQVSLQVLGKAVEDYSNAPLETGYGIWAKHGPAPSAEEIDENRRETFRSFEQERSCSLVSLTRTPLSGSFPATLG